jgi:hypothetical protein
MYHVGLGGLAATGGTLAATGFTAGGVLVLALAACLGGLVLLRYAVIDLGRQDR